MGGGILHRLHDLDLGKCLRLAKRTHQLNLGDGLLDLRRPSQCPQGL